MKYCINCGQEMQEDAKFCPNCGQDQTKEVKQEEQKEEQQKEKQSFTDNEKVQQTMILGKNYWKYFLAKLRWPTAELTEDPFYFGYLSVGLYTLLQGLLTTLLISHGLGMIDALLQSFGGYGMGVMPDIGSVADEIGFTFFLRMFFLYLLTSAVTLGILFGIEKLCLKTVPHFNQTVLQVGNYLNGLNLVLLVFILGLFIQLFSAVMSFVILLLSSFIFQIALIFVVSSNSKEGNSKISPFYVVLLVFVVNVIVNGILFSLVIR